VIAAMVARTGRGAGAGTLFFICGFQVLLKKKRKPPDARYAP